MHKLAVFLEEKLKFCKKLLITKFIITPSMIHGMQTTAKQSHVGEGRGQFSSQM